MLPGLPDRRLTTENEDLHASRRRLVLAADAERRRIERDLHEGIQQELVALAVKVQLARESTQSDAVEEIARDVDRAIDDLRQLAGRIHPPLLESGGLVAAVRSAAAGATGSLDIAADFDCPPELAGTVYACCVAALECGMAVSVRMEDETLVFEVAEGGDQLDVIERIRDRVEALDGVVVVGPPRE